MAGILPHRDRTKLSLGVGRPEDQKGLSDMMGIDVATHGTRSMLCCLVLLRAAKHMRLPPHLHRAGLPTRFECRTKVRAVTSR